MSNQYTPFSEELVVLKKGNDSDRLVVHLSYAKRHK
jgi:hypothetical protein